MEKYSCEEILRALSLIKDICHNTDCMHCPFGDSTVDYNCEITALSPNNWDIKSIEEPTIWRAFL